MILCVSTSIPKSFPIYSKCQWPSNTIMPHSLVILSPYFQGLLPVYCNFRVDLGPQTHFPMIGFQESLLDFYWFLKAYLLIPIFSWTLFGDEIFLRMEVKVKAKYSCDRVHTSLFLTFCWRFSPHPPNLHSLCLLPPATTYLQPLAFLHLCHHILSSLWHLLIILNISVQLHPMLGLIPRSVASTHFLFGFSAKCPGAFPYWSPWLWS